MTTAPEVQVSRIAMVARTTLRPFLLVSITTGNSCAMTPPYAVPLCAGLAAADNGDTSSAPAATAQVQPIALRMAIPSAWGTDTRHRPARDPHAEGTSGVEIHTCRLSRCRGGPAP